MSILDWLGDVTGISDGRLGVQRPEPPRPASIVRSGDYSPVESSRPRWTPPENETPARIVRSGDYTPIRPPQFRPQEPEPNFALDPIGAYEHRLNSTEGKLFPKLREDSALFRGIMRPFDIAFAALNAPFEAYSQPIMGIPQLLAEKDPARFGDVIRKPWQLTKVAKEWLEDLGPGENEFDWGKMAREEGYQAFNRTPLLYQLGAGVVADPLNLVPFGLVGKARQGARLAEYTKPLSKLMTAEELGMTARKGGVLGAVTGLFRKTPESEAFLRSVDAVDHVGALAAMAPTPEAMVKAVDTFVNPETFAAQAGRSPSMMSRAGQRTHHLMQGFNPNVSMARYKQGASNRNALEAAAKEAGMSLEDLGKRLDAGEIPDQALQDAWKLSKSAPKNDAEFFGEMMRDLSEHVMANAAQMYGVQKAGLMTRMMNLAKSAQSVPFLGLNPGYLINNYTNNLATTLLDGVFPWFTGRQKELVRRLGGGRFMPTRYDASVGPADIARAEETAKTPLATLQKGLEKARQTETTALERGVKKFSSKTPMVNMAGRVERAHSEGAFARGIAKVWHQLWRPGKGFSDLPPTLRTALDVYQPGLSNKIIRAIQSSANPDEVIEKLFKGRRSILEALDDAHEQGRVTDAAREMLLGTDEFQAIDNLPDAEKLPALEKLVDQMQDRHSELGKKVAAQLAEDEAEKMATGRPGAAMWLLRQNELDRSNTFARRSRILTAARANEEPKSWEAAMRQVAAEFEYFWANEDRRIELITKYLAANQIKIPKFDALRKSVRDTRKAVEEWRAAAKAGQMGPGEFPTLVNSAWQGHFDLADQMHDELYRAILGNVARDNPEAAAFIDQILGARQALRVKDREILTKYASLDEYGKRGADWDTIDMMRRDSWAAGMKQEDELLRQFFTQHRPGTQVIQEAPRVRNAAGMAIKPKPVADVQDMVDDYISEFIEPNRYTSSPEDLARMTEEANAELLRQLGITSWDEVTAAHEKRIEKIINALRKKQADEVYQLDLEAYNKRIADAEGTLEYVKAELANAIPGEIVKKHWGGKERGLRKTRVGTRGKGKTDTRKLVAPDKTDYTDYRGQEWFDREMRALEHGVGGPDTALENAILHRRELLDLQAQAQRAKREAKPKRPVVEPYQRKAKAPYAMPEGIENAPVEAPKEDLIQPGKEGWKLHLATSDPQAVSAELTKMGLKHKVGRSGGQAGKDITVYIGRRDEAEDAANTIASQLGHLLGDPAGDVLTDDLLIAPKVMGRFDVAGTPGNVYHQYGLRGVPFLFDDMGQVQLKGLTPEQARQRAHQRLVQEFGEAYTGTRGNPVDDLPTRQASKAVDEAPVDVTAGDVKAVDEVAPQAPETPRVPEAPAGDELVDFTDPMPDNYDYHSNIVSSMSDGVAATASAYDKLLPTDLRGLSPEMGAALQDWLKTVFGEMGEARFAAYKGGEWLRDLALLNYNQRYGMNTFLGYIFPYEFWFTSSLRNWALKFAEQPNLAAMYSRARRMLQTKEEEPGYPTRLKGMLKMQLPFMPEWAGDFFFDPLSSFGLPLENFTQGLSQLEYGTKRADLEKQLQDAIAKGAPAEEIAELEQALKEAPGREWTDYAGIFANPGLHLTVPYQLLFGKGTEGIQPMMPGSRFVEGATALLGVNEGKGIDVEGGMRRWANERLGTSFPEGDEWDTYRVERMLSNMAADGTITADEARRAMLEKSGPAWELAQARANQEATRGPLGMIAPGRQGLYPTGERTQKLLGKELGATYDLPEDQRKAAQKQLYDEHPEINARQALFDQPGERYREYLNDAIWDLSDLDKRRLKDQYPDEMQRFYDKQATTQDLARLATAIGVDLPEMAAPKPGDPTPPFVGRPEFQPGPAVQRVSPQQAEAYAGFMDAIERRFGNAIYDVQSQYFEQPKGAARRKFVEQHPELQAYWDARDDFKRQHPDVAKLAWPTSATPSAYNASQNLYAQAVEILKKRNWRR
jgi:hypothetical protein